MAPDTQAPLIPGHTTANPPFDLTLNAATIEMVPVDQGQIEWSSRVSPGTITGTIDHNASITDTEIYRGNRFDLSNPFNGSFTERSVGYLSFAVPDLGSQVVTGGTLLLEWSGTEYAYDVNGFHNDADLLQANHSEWIFLPGGGPARTVLNDLEGGPVYASGTTAGQELDSKHDSNRGDQRA